MHNFRKYRFRFTQNAINCIAKGMECGVGNLDVGSDSYSGLGREKSISNKGADRKLNLECGMGNISVDFSGKEHRDLQTS